MGGIGKADRGENRYLTLKALRDETDIIDRDGDVDEAGFGDR